MMFTSICLGCMSSAVGPQVIYPAGSTVLRCGFRVERPSAPSTHRTIAIRAHTSPELATLADGLSISAPFAVLSGALLAVSSGHAGVLLVGALVAAVRSYCYAQLTFVTASMLSKNLPKSDLRVIQIGGGIKELYYYPSSTVQVTVIDEDAKEGLYEQAATQAGVPVVCRKEPLKNIDRMMPQTADAVVLLSRLQEVDDLSAFLKVVHKLLRKGGRFIFIQPVKSDSASVTQQVVGSASAAYEIAKLDLLQDTALFKDVQFDVSNKSLDPHVVGLAIAA